MAGIDFSSGGQGLNVDDFRDIWSTAAGIGADNSLDTPRTSGTVTSNALQTMQGESDPGESWGDFWKGTLKTITNYALVKDAMQSGVAPGARGGAYYTAGPNGQTPTYVQPAQGNLMPLLLIGAVIAGVVLIAKD